MHGTEYRPLPRYLRPLSIPRGSQLSGSNSTIVRVKYQLDDTAGNEVGGDEDLRNTTLSTVYNE